MSLTKDQQIETLSKAPISSIKTNLDRIFGKEVWLGWELETISDELKIGFNELTLDKIKVLQLLCANPDLFSSNAIFFLHVTDVINNIIADFEYVPMPTSLELAYALFEIKKILGTRYLTPTPDSDVSDVLTYLLIEDGFSEPIEPFQFLKATKFEKGTQPPIDMKAKKMGIDEYIKHMETL